MKNMNILRDIESEGYTISREKISYEDFLGLAEGLGKIVNYTDVKIDTSKNYYFTNPEAMPYHSDCGSIANYIGWYCADTDLKNVPTKILDTKHIINALSRMDKEILKTISIKISTYQYDSLYTENNYGNYLCYLPWLAIISNEQQKETLEKLNFLIEEYALYYSKEISLEKHEFLFLDDRRMLHARDKLPLNAKRFLRRIWIKRHN